MSKITKYKKKIFLISAMLAIVCIICALLIFTVQNKKRITAENREYLVDNASQVAENIDSAISAGFDNIKILSALVGQSLTGPEFDIADIQGQIKNSVFDFVEFADKYGMDHNITGGVSDATDREYYLNAKEGITGMELIHVSRATHETLLMFYSPVYYKNEFVGSLVGVYQASNRITKLLSSEYFGESAVAYLATDEGRIIASNQGFDPQQEMYVYDIAEGNTEVAYSLESALASGTDIVFSLEENTTGGCMTRLKENGGYVIQIFPHEASIRLIKNANRLGYNLVIALLVIFIIFMCWIMKFYRSQQRQIEIAKNQAEIANQAKTSFLFSMSHDIRTPMNAILGYTDIALKHQHDSDRVGDSLRKIKSSGEHLLRLINDILEMSRIESGNLLLSENPTDIREIINNVTNMSQVLARSKSINFATIIGEIKNPYIYADELHLNEVLINLISNAVKYTNSEGDVEFRVCQVEDEREGKVTFRFEVADDGIGMSKEFQKHLFEAFAREETSTVSKIEGTGLGLSIVKRIVELSNGTITVKSRLDIGSTFTVEIPFCVMDEQLIEEYLNRDSSDKTAENSKSLENKRVLLVEDNEMNREIAEEILSDAGLIVETAEDGREAVNLISDRKKGYYDFILMDIQMPLMNGYEATRLIRLLPNGEDISIVALSANAFEEDRKKSLDAGMNAHIAKPIDPDALLTVLRELKVMRKSCADLRKSEN